MGLFVPAQKTLLELPQEAVPVGYVLILQIFELCQECSRLEGVVVALPDTRMWTTPSACATQMAEVAIARQMFQEILRLIAELRPQPPPALA